LDFKDVFFIFYFRTSRAGKLLADWSRLDIICHDSTPLHRLVRSGYLNRSNWFPIPAGLGVLEAL